MRPDPRSAASSDAKDADYLRCLHQIDRRSAAQALARGENPFLVADTQGVKDDVLFWAAENDLAFRNLLSAYEDMDQLPFEERMDRARRLAWDALERHAAEGDSDAIALILRECRLNEGLAIRREWLAIRREELELKRQRQLLLAEGIRQRAVAGEARAARAAAKAEPEAAAEAAASAPIPDPQPGPDGMLVPWDEEELERLSHLPPKNRKPETAEESYALYLVGLSLEQRQWRKAIYDPRAWDGLDFLPQVAIEEQYREQGDCSGILSHDELEIARKADEKLEAWHAISRQMAREAMGIGIRHSDDTAPEGRAAPERGPVPAPERGTESAPEHANDDPCRGSDSAQQDPAPATEGGSDTALQQDAAPAPKPANDNPPSGPKRAEKQSRQAARQRKRARAARSPPALG